jgi:rubrerythrin
MRTFASLSEREILALAISNEEEDGRIYADFADGLRETFPDSAKVFTDMAAEEGEHRRMLIDLYVEKFGEHIPLIQRQYVRGFPARKPVWQYRPLRIDVVRQVGKNMEIEAANFYRQAALKTNDAKIRKLLGDLAEAEVGHQHAAEAIERKYLTPANIAAENDSAQRRLLLQIVQPGLVGLMDGSVSTLAPVFAAAFATHTPWDAFLVGVAASIGAGISMGFAEALADDGKLSGRGAPLLRGLICGLMTAIGGIFHTLPFLISSFWPAVIAAGGVVAVELAVITWIRWKFMETPPVSAAFQVMFGGALVFLCGVLIGTS